MTDEDPAVSVFSTPGISVCINQFYLPFVTGALEVLAVGDYWENPDSVLPEIDKLIAALNMPAGDCEAPETPFCGEYDFVSASHDDVWEGLSTPSPCDPAIWTNDFYNGWAQISCDPSGTNGVIMNIHAHFSTILTLNRMEILYSVYGVSGADQSYVVLWKGTTRGDVLIFVDGGLGLTTDMVHNRDFTDVSGQDFVVEVQLNNPSPPGPINGDIVIHQLRFFGSGDAPDGSLVCVE